MAVQYSDPYKENKFGSIYGEFSGETFGVYFEEARFYRKDDKTITLAGKFTKLPGVLRKWKPESATMPTLLTLDFHKEDYEANVKDDKGNWIKVPRKVSGVQRFLYEQIEKNPSSWRLHPCDESIPKDIQALSGWISFFDAPSIVPLLPEEPGLKCHAWEINYVPATDVSEWNPSSINSSYGKGNGFNRVYVSETQKLEERENKLTEFLKKTHASMSDATDLFSVSQKLAPLYEENKEAFDLYLKLMQLVYR
ncbi:MAG: hypothetical protein ACRC11_08130 [Xenococcaceae cyanobacterium]